MKPSVSVVIVNYNGEGYVGDAIRSALAQNYDGEFEVVVVDNASTDESPATLRSVRGIRLIESPKNVGFGAAVNLALRSIQRDYVALLNPDARAEPQWLATMIPWMRSGEIDLASSVIGAGIETYFARGRFLETLGATIVSQAAAAETDWISGCALIARRSSLERLAGFDEGFFLYYEDVDLSLRARALGMRLRVLPERLVDHPRHGRSTDALGTAKAALGYYGRGRLIGRHVRGWRRLPALLFTGLLSPIRAKVAWASIAPVEKALLRGYRDVRRVRSSHLADKRPVVGVLLNIYERTAGLGAGGHRHFIEVIRRWKETDLILFGPSSARDAVLAEVPDARYVALPSLEGVRAGKAVDFLFRSVAWVRALPKLRSCDVVLSTSHFLPDVMPAIFSGRPSVIIVHHLIGSDGTAIRASAIPQIAERAALLLIRFGARAVLASSSLVAGQLRRRSFRIPIRVTTSGVEHVAFPVARFSAENERRGALFIGRMHPAKGALDAVRAWRRVVDERPDALLTLMGAREVESYAREVEAFVSLSGLSRNVDIRGKTSDAEKIEAMMRAQMFLFPSHEEGWGIALAEAMRAGLPCVTYALPIFAEIFPRGRLEAPLGDTDALARQTLAILSDESLRLRLSGESSALAKDFTWARASQIEGETVRAFITS